MRNETIEYLRHIPSHRSVIYRKLWPLPVEDLLYVGSATKHKLHKYYITTIGKLANTPVYFLNSKFGKVGDVLYTFANGLDRSPVAHMDLESQIKSVGNSTTTPRDLVNDEDAKVIFYVLCESVCARMREHGFKCRTVQISVRDTELIRFERQTKLPFPSNISNEVFASAMHLFKQNYAWDKPIRSLGIRGTDLIPAVTPMQLSLFVNEE